MATAQLMLHCGARSVPREVLEEVPTPEPAGRWRPVPFGTVLSYAEQALQESGFGIQKEHLALARNDQQFFGTLTLSSDLPGGSSLAVGLRSSHDQSLSLGWCIGNRVFVCDNLAFSSQIVIARKHTTFGIDRYQEAICKAVKGLPEYRNEEAQRIERMQNRSITDCEAESALLRLFEKGILSTRTLPDAICEWRKPTYEEFRPRTIWSLYNAVTSAIWKRAETNPQAHALATIRLGHVLAA